MCPVTHKWVNVRVSARPSDPGVEAIKRWTRCAGALSIMAGSAPNVTFVTGNDSVEGKEGGGHLLPDTGPPVRGSRLTTDDV